MGRHTITDDEGNPRHDSEGNELIWSDQDGDSRDHQTVYRDTPYGAKEVPDKHYDPDEGEFHKK